MTEALQGSISQEDKQELSSCIQKLKAVYEEGIARAGAEPDPIESQILLDKTAELKVPLDKLRKVDFGSNTEKLKSLVGELDKVKAQLKDELKRLNKIVDTLETVVEIAAILDDAAKIAAGLAKSL